MTNKITQAIWFHTLFEKMNHVSDYYKTIFENKFEVGQFMPLGETPSGYGEMCNVNLFGNPYFTMTTSKVGTTLQMKSKNRSVVGAWINSDYDGKYFQKI